MDRCRKLLAYGIQKLVGYSSSSYVQIAEVLHRSAACAVLSPLLYALETSRNVWCVCQGPTIPPAPVSCNKLH